MRKKMEEVKKDSKGFTLIELLVVVAIIAILAAIAIPQYAKYRRKAFNSAALSDLKSIQNSAEAYYADHEQYPAESDLDVTLSAGVSKAYKTDSGKTYAAVTKHTQGDKEFGTASDLGEIVYRSAEVGSSSLSLSEGNSSAFDSTWHEVGK